ncbi:MAG TPA: hypothetical protein VGH76_26380 [Actinomycetospora sp.]|jgi:hypothetical protein|uniref:hypothetical protein n=1 Tax=Actinomycetospora sp. TaxID=1872135 RepID=UPI002F3E396B
MVAARVGWRVETTAVSGTGYVAHPPGTLPYDAGQVDRMEAAHPAVLVVEGSQNDRFADPRTVGPAATAPTRTCAARSRGPAPSSWGRSRRTRARPRP